MNSNEGLKYELYTKYCFVHCCNHLPEKVESPCRLIPHTFGVTPWSKKKKGTCTHSFNFFVLFFISCYFFIYLFIYFFTEPGFKLLGEKKRENAVTISINISWLTFREQEKSYQEKVVVEWCNKKWISSTQSMWSFVRKVLWKDCSQNEVDLSSLNTLLSLLT